MQSCAARLGGLSQPHTHRGTSALAQGRRALTISAVAAPVKEPETLNAPMGRGLGGAAAPRPTPVAVQGADRPASTTGRVVLESEAELRSTTTQRAWVCGGMALMAATLAEGLAHVQGPGDAAVAGAAALAAYYLADMGTAFYHWGVDNYGDASTPVFGRQIAAFQGHHQRPWTITEREFCNNMAPLLKPATPFAAGLLGLALAGAPMWWDVWSSTFLFLCCMSQQFHAWSHMKKSELPGLVVALQEANLLISRRDHGAHHKSPFNTKYSIVSGWSNALLDGPSPDQSVYMRLERWIADKYGVEPRGWYEPDEYWTEQVRPDQA